MANNPQHPLPDMAPLPQVVPVVLGYLPVGFAYGVLAQKVGLSLVNAVLMSLIVYAGSAQLISVGLFAAGAAPLSIIATTLIVNLRHLLMTASLAPWLRGWSKRALALFGAQITDESFAIHAMRLQHCPDDRRGAFTINVVAQLAWIGGSLLGFVAGHLMHDIKPFGIDFALPAMFIALLVAQCRQRGKVLTALLAGLLAVGLTLAGLERWSVVLATVVAASVATAGVLWTSE